MRLGSTPALRSALAQRESTREDWVMQRKRGRISLLILALALGLILAVLITHRGWGCSEETFLLQSPEQALLEDAEEYAWHWGVSVDEALRVSELGNRIGEMQAELEEKEKETFAGLWSEHTPRFRVIVLFTRDGEETIRPYAESRGLLDVIEVRSAQRSLAELEAAQIEYTTIVQDVLGSAVSSSDIKVKDNCVEIYVLDKTHPLEELQNAHVRLPGFVHVIKIERQGGFEQVGASPSTIFGWRDPG
jgi:hypothetical protein